MNSLPEIIYRVLKRNINGEISYGFAFQYGLLKKMDGENGKYYMINRLNHYFFPINFILETNIVDLISNSPDEKNQIFHLLQKNNTSVKEILEFANKFLSNKCFGLIDFLRVKDPKSRTIPIQFEILKDPEYSFEYKILIEKGRGYSEPGKRTVFTFDKWENLDIYSKNPYTEFEYENSVKCNIEFNKNELLEWDNYLSSIFSDAK